MEAKEYLKQLKLLNVKIDNKQKELDDLRLMAQSTGGIDYSSERVQTSLARDSLEKKVIRYVCLEQEINDEIDKYVDLKHKIINEIHTLTNPIYIEVLYMHYVEFKRLQEIAVEMNYSYQYVRELHGHALQEFSTTYTKLH